MWAGVGEGRGEGEGEGEGEGRGAGEGLRGIEGEKHHSHHSPTAPTPPPPLPSTLPPSTTSPRPRSALTNLTHHPKSPTFRVRPQQVAHGTVVGHLLLPVDNPNLIKRVHRWRQAAMHAEYPRAMAMARVVCEGGA